MNTSSLFAIQDASLDIQADKNEIGATILLTKITILWIFNFSSQVF